MDPKEIFVHAPTRVVFLCGGELSEATAPLPCSIRDAFLRAGTPPGIKKYQVVLAEDTNPFRPRSIYTDLLDFESDIAQISELVLLFSESAGSFTELGAFAMHEEISARLLAVVEQFYYAQDSFIRHGPLAHLEQTHGDAAVCVLDGHELNIRTSNKSSLSDIGKINVDVFKERIFDAIDQRLARKHEPRKYNGSNNGQHIKLIVGLIQQYGGLIIDEIVEYLNILQINLSIPEITKFLMCAEIVGWVIKEKRGLRTYFFASAVPQAVNFSFIGASPHKNKERWRTEIREHWKQTDGERYTGIANGALTGGVA